jgi:ketosteroid isomerase-like protein
MTEESRTPDLVERVRGLFDAAQRRDFDGVLSFYAPGAVWESVDLGTSFEGVAAIRGFWEEWFTTFDNVQVELEQVLDLDNGVVLALYHQSGRPGNSTFAVRSSREAFVYEWVAGLIVRVTAYTDIDEAPAAAERLAEARG